MKYLYLFLVLFTTHLAAYSEWIGQDQGIAFPIEHYYECGGRVLTNHNWEGKYYQKEFDYEKKFYLVHKEFEFSVNPEEFIEFLRDEAELAGAEISQQTFFYSGESGRVPMIRQVLSFKHSDVIQLYIFGNRKIYALSATVSKLDEEGIDMWKDEWENSHPLIHFCSTYEY